jgi:hypothetical protein
VYDRLSWLLLELSVSFSYLSIMLSTTPSTGPTHSKDRAHIFRIISLLGENLGPLGRRIKRTRFSLACLVAEVYLLRCTVHRRLHLLFELRTSTPQLTRHWVVVAGNLRESYRAFFALQVAVEGNPCQATVMGSLGEVVGCCMASVA